MLIPPVHPSQTESLQPLRIWAATLYPANVFTERAIYGRFCHSMSGTRCLDVSSLFSHPATTRWCPDLGSSRAQAFDLSINGATRHPSVRSSPFGCDVVTSHLLRGLTHHDGNLYPAPPFSEFSVEPEGKV